MQQRNPPVFWSFSISISYLTHCNNNSPHFLVTSLTYTDDDSSHCWYYMIAFLFHLFLILFNSYFSLLNRQSLKDRENLEDMRKEIIPVARSD